MRPNSHLIVLAAISILLWGWVGFEYFAIGMGECFDDKWCARYKDSALKTVLWRGFAFQAFIALGFFGLRPRARSDSHGEQSSGELSD